jgi:lipopolysaccharide/colanic/teichoic acid biosynthesis glycosyltransferase
VAVLLVSSAGFDSHPTRRAIIDAVTAVTRQTDVVGWIDRQVIGVVLAEATAFDARFARTIDDRLRRELAKHLDAAALDRCSTRLHVYPEVNAAAPSASQVETRNLLVAPEEGRTVAYHAVKRALDIIGSIALLVVLSPLLLLIAALVKLMSPGPLFFRQIRIGQGMKRFTMLKFRTMHVNADHSIHHEFVTLFIKSKSQNGEPGSKALFKIVDDPRVTPIGRVLRKTSLDELPQLWNVLRGDMSLVGPRPPVPYELEQYQRWHQRRVLDAKPGITGLWQVSGRSRTTFDDMVRLDIRYAQRRSLWNDLKILLATPGAVISGKGAC